MKQLFVIVVGDKVVHQNNSWGCTHTLTTSLNRAKMWANSDSAQRYIDSARPHHVDMTGAVVRELVLKPLECDFKVTEQLEAHKEAVAHASHETVDIVHQWADQHWTEFLMRRQSG